MQYIIEFFNTAFFSVGGGIRLLIMIWGILLIFFWVIKGCFPVLYKIGSSLSKRKIAIFADEKYDDLKAILVDSGMFKEKNIIQIHKESLKKAADASLYLVHYSCFKDKIDEIISVKKDSDAMIVYSPKDDGPIADDILNKINAQRNTILVNFRGRLLNDIFISMITTRFQS